MDGARIIIKTLRSAGYQAYLVGGCVRDMQLGIQPKDHDVATDAHPEDVARLFDRVIPTGMAHGTMTVLQDRRPYEVTTFRRDVECDGRRAVVESHDSLEEDLARRDFTVNALAQDPETSEVIDPHGGLSDLKARLLRCVGDPDRRFEEDHLRLLRAVRFAAQLEFQIEDGTWQALCRVAHKIDRISKERIADELWAILAAPAAHRGFRLLDSSGLLPFILPEISQMKDLPQPERWHHLDVFEHTLLALEKAVALSPDPLVRLATLLHDVGKASTLSRDDKGTVHFYGHEHRGAEMIAQLVSRMRLASSRRIDLDARQLTDRLQLLVRLHLRPRELELAGTAALRRFAREAGPWLDDVMLVARADRMAHRDPDTTALDRLQQNLDALGDVTNLHRIDSPLSGRELMDILGLAPGRQIGQAKKALIAAIVDGELKNNADAARDWILKHFKS